MSENTKWFSQTLLTFKDKQFATEGYFRVAITTNTEDYKYFQTPMLNISISNANNYQKSVNLNIQNAEDLVESFDKIIKQLNGNDLVIEKDYNKKSKLYFKFAVDNSTQSRVVVTEIYSNDTDAVKIIIPLKPTLQSFLRRLRYFVDKYDNICIKLLTQSINYENTSIIQQLPGLIKGISSQIIEQDIILDSRAPEPDPSEVAQTETVSYDFDKFLGDDMENIKLPETEINGIVQQNQAETIVEINSSFMTKVLKNDLTTLESKLTSFAVSKNPVIDMAEDLRNQLGFDVLSGINDDDRKSLSYLSKLLLEYNTKAYTINETPIPDKTTTLKFRGKESKENIELAKDLLTIIGYMRLLRRRLETKFDNAYDNKSLVYIYLRFIMDAYCFSFLQNFTHSEIKASIMNRYKYFNKIGIFEGYKKVLDINNCSAITDNDIEGFADEVYDNIVKTPMIDQIHEMMIKSGFVKLPSKNTFNLEQIINEFVLLEVNEMLGFDFKDDTAVSKLRDSGISDEMIKFFKGNKKINVKTKTKKITPLQRVVEKFQQDIPEKYKEEVKEYIQNLEYKKFDFSNCKWPLEEFDSRVVVAFYIWDVESDPEMKTNFTHFMSLVESEQMTKDDIIIANKEVVKNENKTFGFEDINFEM